MDFENDGPRPSERSLTHQLRAKSRRRREGLERLCTPAPAQASTPSDVDIDLSSWRSDHEIADRQDVERAVALFLKEARPAAALLQAPAAYQKLVDCAPDFLKEFTTNAGLSVNRYWREAVGRAGEARIDRKTIPIVGSLCLQENVARLSSIIEYGLLWEGAASKHHPGSCSPAEELGGHDIRTRDYFDNQT